MENDISDRRLYEYLEAGTNDEPDDVDDEYICIDPDWEMDDERERYRE